MVRVCASMYRFSIGSLLEIQVAYSIENNPKMTCQYAGLQAI